VIVWIDLIEHHIPRSEFDDLVRPGAYRLEVVRCLARALPCVLGEEVLGQNLPAAGFVPARVWVGKHHLDCLVVELLDATDIFIHPAAGGGRSRVGGILTGEDHIVGREGPAIVPDHPLFEAPDRPGAILRAAAVLDAGDFLRQDWDEIAIGIYREQRFVDDARSRNVLRAGCEVGIEDRRRLPIQ
jgi:hypothetical protein